MRVIQLRKEHDEDYYQTVRKLLSRFLVLMSLLCVFLPLNRAHAQETPLTGTYTTQDTFLIRQVRVTDQAVVLEINQEALGQQAQLFQQLVSHNQRAIEKHIKPSMTSEEIEKVRQELGLNLEAFEKVAAETLAPDKLVEALENQVSGVYTHVTETGTIYLRLTKPEVKQSGDTVYVRVLGEEVLQLTGVTETGFSIDKAKFEKQ